MRNSAAIAAAAGIASNHADADLRA